jgi:hypothetical protein
MTETLEDMLWALEVPLYEPLGNDENLLMGEWRERCSVGSLTTRGDIEGREGRAGKRIALHLGWNSPQKERPILGPGPQCPRIHVGRDPRLTVEYTSVVIGRFSPPVPKDRPALKGGSAGHLLDLPLGLSQVLHTSTVGNWTRRSDDACQLLPGVGIALRCVGLFRQDLAFQRCRFNLSRRMDYPAKQQ